MFLSGMEQCLVILSSVISFIRTPAVALRMLAPSSRGVGRLVDLEIHLFLAT